MWLLLFVWDPPKLRMETCCKKTVVFAIENVWIALICRRYDYRAYSLHLTIIRVSSVIILCIMEISCCITWQCLEAEKSSGLVGRGNKRKRCLSFSPTRGSGIARGTVHRLFQEIWGTVPALLLCLTLATFSDKAYIPLSLPTFQHYYGDTMGRSIFKTALFS